MYLIGILGLGLAYLISPDVRGLAATGFEILMTNDQTRVRDWVAGFGAWGPILIIGLMIAQTLISAVPMILVLIVAVLAYGPVWGGLLGWSGAILAAMIGYGIARVFGDALQDKFVTPQIKNFIEKQVSKYGAWAILALRLSPVIPSDGVSFVAGLLRMKPGPFIGGTIGGVTPVVIAVAYLGSDFERLRNAVIAVSVLSLTALVAWIIYDQMKLKREMQKQRKDTSL